MFSGECEYQVDVIIGYELVDGIHEIEEPDEIEFGLVLLQQGFELTSFFFVIFRHLYIVFMVYVDDVQPGFEQVEDFFDRLDGDGVLDVLKVSEQHNIFG